MWAEGFQACFCLCSLRPAHVQSQGATNTSGKIRLIPTCHINHGLLEAHPPAGKALQVGMNTSFHVPSRELLQMLHLFVLMDAWKNCGSSEQTARAGKGGQGLSKHCVYRKSK